MFCSVLFVTLYFQPDRWENTEFPIREPQDVFACVEAFKFKHIAMLRWCFAIISA